MSAVHRGRWILALLALAAALVGGCGGDDSGRGKQAGGGGGAAGGGGGNCQDADKALTDAARGHVGPLKVAKDGVGGDVDRITLDVCRTTDENASAEVVVYGMRDKAIRDVRHRILLIKVGGLWQVTDDVDARRCQQGHGHQEYSGDLCE